jgi:hypothetical protein
VGGGLGGDLGATGGDLGAATVVGCAGGACVVTEAGGGPGGDFGAIDPDCGRPANRGNGGGNGGGVGCARKNGGLGSELCDGALLGRGGDLPVLAFVEGLPFD